MSQDPPRRPTSTTHGSALTEPIKYGDVFDVSGGVADQPVAPRDAAMMQSAENLVLGETPKGAAASKMQSAATRNENAGIVGHEDLSPAARGEGMIVTERDVPGRRVVTEWVRGQVVEHFATTAAVTTPPVVTDAFTIGDTLEATAVTAGEKPVTQSDASAILAAEDRATGRTSIVPGGIGSIAMSAADANEWTLDEDDKTTLEDVLAEEQEEGQRKLEAELREKDAKAKLPADKAVTARDAERVTGAELRNSPSLATYPGGVADTMTAAARLNQQST